MISESSPSTLGELLEQYEIGVGTGPSFGSLAEAIMAAYKAYPFHMPKLDHYDIVGVIKVWEPAEGGHVTFGFTAAAKDGTHNILALRGTFNTDEGFWDVKGWGAPIPFYLTDQYGNKKQYGNAQGSLAGFYQDDGFGTYKSLARSLKEAVSPLNSKLPLYIAAHSLGGAMATFGALDIMVSGVYPNSPRTPTVLTFGSLHVGDLAFAQAYTSKLPMTLRVANLCDFVPSLVGLSPASGNPPPPTPYVHVGAPVVFVWQKWDDWANHSMQYTYQVVVDQYIQVLTLGTPTDVPYPAPWQGPPSSA